MKTIIKLFYGFWLLLVFSTLSMKVKAQKEPVFTAPLIGDSIKVGKKMVVKDSVFFNPLLKPTINQTYFINNLVTLKINEDTSRILPDSFSLSVKLKFIYVAPDTLSDSIAQKILTINYYKDKPYTDKAVFYFQGAHYVEAQILEVTSQYATLAAILPRISMENRMVISRDYLTNCVNNAINIVSKDVSTISSDGELKIYWVPNGVSQMYDVEWTFLDKSALDNGRYNTGGSLDAKLIFKNNSTRVTTKGTSYQIPLLYDGDGTLFYRVRGTTIDGAGEVLATQWSSEANTNPSNWSYIFSGHERKMNWQATTSFAEEGKRKSIIQYFDGSLRERQTVTRDNTTKTTVVAETLYDKQGRPMIQVMPAPTLSTLIKYTSNFNVKDAAGNEYDKAVYDTLLNSSDYCSTGAPPMNSLKGASQYYSPNNPQKSSGMNRFIPEAYGYVFTETQYAQDNTGRIYRQGGVGPDFKIGGGHETKYYYSVPDQNELDALFGTEAGEASHYQKNMVRDPNGQYSVSYVDMHGRTIATALAGTPPTSMQALPNYKLDSLQTDQLLSPTSNIINGSSIEFSRTILMTKNDSAWFTYSMGKQSLTLQTCKQNNICYDCLYDLSITIAGDCANSVSGKNDTTIRLSNFPLFRVDTTCGLAIPLNKTLAVFLKEGSYTVSKTLSISQKGLDFYRDSVFLPRNTCISYDNFLKLQIQLVKDSLKCNSDTLKTASYLQYREQMLLDMYALEGQYGEPASGRCFSIFDKKSGKPLYKVAAETGTYKDENGQDDFIVNSSGQLVRPEDLSQEEFIANFKGSWANTLLPLHPEYCLLLQYESFALSHIWDEDFEATDTYAGAVAKGYLNPTASASAPANKFTPGNDPLYSLSFAAGAKAAIQDSLLKFRYGNNDASNPYLTLWGFATALARCSEPIQDACLVKWNKPANVFSTDSLCTGELDMAWRTFRAIYLEKKREWIDRYLRQQCGPSLAGVCNQVFLSKDNLLSQSGYTANGGDQSVGTNNANQFYSDNCNSYRDRWIEQLGSCYTPAQREIIIERLVQVCKEGADQDHPFGSSTVKPSSSYIYKSFQQVIKSYNDTLGINSINCNAYLIDKPLPYNQQTISVQKPVWGKPDSCTCVKINSLYTSYIANTTGYANFSDYIKKTTQTIIGQPALDSLRGLCNNSINCKFITKPIILPPVLQCGIEGLCISCLDYKVAYDSFLIMFPNQKPMLPESNAAQQDINRVFANYMNQRFGFSKTAVDYLKFSMDCGYTNNETFKDTLLKYIKDFRDNYNALAKGQIYKNYKISPAAIALVEGSNAMIQARQFLSGSNLPTGYAIAPFTYNFDAKLKSVIRNSSADSGYQVILPLPLQYTVGRYITINELETNTVVSSDFVTGTATSNDLAYKYYAVVSRDIGNSFHNIWSSDNYGAYAYYGVSTPMLKYLPNTANGSIENHIYTFTYFKPTSFITSPSTYVSYFYDSVYAGSWYGHYKAPAIFTNTIKAIKDLRFAPEVLPLPNMTNFVRSSTGLKVTITFRDNSQSDAYIYNNHDGGDIVTWKQVIDSNVYHPNCSVAFVNYFNQQRGANYSSSQIDSIFQSNLGTVPNPCGSTCSTYDSILQAFPAYYQANGGGRPCQTVFAEYFNSRGGTNYTYTQIKSLYSACGTFLNACGNDTLRLCGKNTPMNLSVNVQPDPCADSTNIAIVIALQKYRMYQDSIKGYFNEAYTKKCLNVGSLESFTLKKPVSEYHYTLYYYDQAGNLVKTIPPKAVQPNRDLSWLAGVKQSRASGTIQVPSHATDPLVTVYRYNSLNQVVSQKTPDGGKSEFWYDRLGRLVVSQNAKQKLESNYSYTLYDEIGRISEVGEKYQVLGMSQTTSRSPLSLKKWIQYRNFESAFLPRMVTYTLYDILNPYAGDYSGYTPFKQKEHTLRNRVSMTRYYAGGLGQAMVIKGTDTTYRPHYWWPSTGVDYSYDIHGNVDSMLTIAWDGSFMSQVNNSFSYRYIAYKYDLISGKINEVHYQGSNAQYKFADEFYHRYEYDADNRLTDVYTTDNRAFLGQQGLEDHDARYEYYKHGPLARVVIGQQQVQGTDYAYTLQGWLKGINSTAMNANMDMGEDGKTTSANKGVARDVYGLNLNYFTGEYVAINGNTPFPGHTAFMPGGAYKPLYNGNISSTAVNIGKLNQPQLYNYGYDQLNRIVSMDVYRGLDQANNNWNSLSAVNDYKERIAYDANGNILKYLRQGYGSALSMDSLNYNYNAGTNQLNHVRDQVASTAYTVDIDNQSANNYTYDAIGNLLTDAQERVTGTTWNVYGKISDVNRSFAGYKTAATHFQYDPSGNRVGKVISTFYEGDRKYWYIRDAQGNVMAVYYSETNPNWTNGPVRLQEHHLYGSSRLGIQKKDFDISQSKATAVNANLVGPTYLYTTVRGSKAYELTNHLGNVLATVSDRKIGHVNGSAYDYYEADVVSASDYYPFGMEMVGRTFSSPLYRYGFNGKEKDDEAKGSGAQYDYGMRIYDPRVSRFLSVDPLTKSYPMLTPYQYASNRPIDGIDLDGLEFFKADKKYSKALYGMNKFEKTQSSYTIGSLNIRYKEIHQIVTDHPRVNENSNLPTEDDSAPEVKVVEKYRDNKKGRWAQRQAVKAANKAMAPDIAGGVIELIKWGKSAYYDLKYGSVLEYAAKSLGSLNQADQLVRKAVENASFPEKLRMSPTALTDLTNYLNDGTLPGDASKEHISLIQTWGNLLYGFREEIMNGKFDFSPRTKQITKVTKVLNANDNVIHTFSVEQEVGNPNPIVNNAVKQLNNTNIDPQTVVKPKQ